MALTNTALNNLKSKPTSYSINDRDNLSIHVSPKGKKTWYFRYRWQGKQCKLSLGSYPVISLKEARINRDKMAALLSQGIDPRTKKINNRESNIKTFQEFVPEWQKIKYLKLGATNPNRRNSTREQIERYLAKDILPALQHLPLDQITRQDIAAILRRMEMRGAFTPAEKCRFWLHEMFRQAVASGYIDINPATDMDVLAQPKPKVSNNPYLTMTELPEFLCALDNYPGDTQIKYALKLMLLTGVRPGEMRFATQEQFNLEEGLWKIPAIEVKQLQRQIKAGKDVPDYIIYKW